MEVNLSKTRRHYSDIQEKSDAIQGNVRFKAALFSAGLQSFSGQATARLDLALDTLGLPPFVGKIIEADSFGWISGWHSVPKFSQNFGTFRLPLTHLIGGQVSHTWFSSI